MAETGALRSQSPCIGLLAALALAGAHCGAPPALLPCDERGPRTVSVGTGGEHFSPIDASGLLIDAGPQGGYHIGFALRCVNFGPEVLVRYGLRDAETGDELTLPDLSIALQLQLDEASGVGEAAGVLAYLDDRFVDALPGTQVVLWATVDDECATPASGETTTFVKDFR